MHEWPDFSLRLAFNIWTVCRYRQNTETHRQNFLHVDQSVGLKLWECHDIMSYPLHAHRRRLQDKTLWAVKYVVESTSMTAQTTCVWWRTPKLNSWRNSEAPIHSFPHATIVSVIELMKRMIIIIFHNIIHPVYLIIMNMAMIVIIMTMMLMMTWWWWRFRWQGNRYSIMFWVWRFHKICKNIKLPG